LQGRVLEKRFPTAPDRPVVAARFKNMLETMVLLPWSRALLDASAAVSVVFSRSSKTPMPKYCLMATVLGISSGRRPRPCDY
jgi:hypothetical protein